MICFIIIICLYITVKEVVAVGFQYWTCLWFSWIIGQNIFINRERPKTNFQGVTHLFPELLHELIKYSPKQPSLVFLYFVRTINLILFHDDIWLNHYEDIIIILLLPESKKQLGVNVYGCGIPTLNMFIIFVNRKTWRYYK